MKSALKVSIFIFAALCLSFCSVFEKSEEQKAENIPQYENYSSSGIYQDIQSEAGDAVTNPATDLSKAQGRKMSSESYEDDDYGNVSGTEEQVDMGDMISEVENDEAPAMMDSGGSDELPIERLQQEEPVEMASVTAPKKSKFKNGMYRTKRDCNMRKKPSAKSAKAGVVNKGKKLWMEGVNSSWVKVYKKSGAVFLSRSCL